MTDCENSRADFEDMAQGLGRMRINNSSGDHRFPKQNGAMQGQRGGRNNRPPRNGFQSQNRAAANGSANAVNGAVKNEQAKVGVNDAQLKTGYPLHQDPAIIAFSGMTVVPTMPAGATLITLAPAHAHAPAVGVGGIPQPYGTLTSPAFANGSFTEQQHTMPMAQPQYAGAPVTVAATTSNPSVQRIGGMLPSNYKDNFTDETRAQAYGSYLDQAKVAGMPQLQSLDRPSTNRRAADRRPPHKLPGEPHIHPSEQTDDFLDANGEHDHNASVRPGYVINKKGVYVRGLEQGTNDAELRARFEPFGAVVQCKVHVDLRTRACLGYGFVEFADEQSARGAIEAFANDPNHSIQVSTMRMPAPDMTNVYVRNLPLNFADRDLETLFASFGKVVSVRILRHPNNVSQGVGFARMSSQSECERIINTYNGCCLPGSPQPLVVKFADDSSIKRSKQRPNRDLASAPATAATSGGFERPRQFRSDTHPQHQQTQQYTGLRSAPPSAHGKVYNQNTNANTRNNHYHQQQQQQHYQHGHSNTVYSANDSMPTYAPPTTGYGPATYPPNGAAFAPNYQPNGYYQPQHQPHPSQFAHPGNYSAVGYPPPTYDQPPNSMFQPAASHAYQSTNDAAAPPPFANVHGNPYYASSVGQPQQGVNGMPHGEPRPNAYGSQPQPSAASPYADPAIIAVRNGLPAHK